MIQGGGCVGGVCVEEEYWFSSAEVLRSSTVENLALTVMIQNGRILSGGEGTRLA